LQTDVKQLAEGVGSCDKVMVLRDDRGAPRGVGFITFSVE